MESKQPYLREIDLECAVRVHLSQKKEIQDPNCPNLDTKNYEAAAFVADIVPEESF
jgi:hypothetical protein